MESRARRTARRGAMVIGAFGAALAAIWIAAVGGRNVWARQAAKSAVGEQVRLPTMHNVLAVDDRLWRGPAPTPAGYGELAAAGVDLVVDLRAEADVHRTADIVAAHGMRPLALSIDNGRVPLPADQAKFEAAHAAGERITYVHCEAGEGRTGAIIGAYQVARRAGRGETVSQQLAVGSLTIAQMLYVATGSRMPRLIALVDRWVDRPTEALFDVAR